MCTMDTVMNADFCCTVFYKKYVLTISQTLLSIYLALENTIK